MSGCGFAHDDGAYVIGALTPADRAAYQRHLPDCPSCQQAVGQLAALPGLLSRLDQGMLAEVTGTGSRAAAASAPESQLPALLAAARAVRRRERVRGRWRYAGSLLVAAALALLVGLGVAGLHPGQDAGTRVDEVPMVSMTPVRDGTRLSAEIGLRGTEWGTMIVMRCRYPGRPGAEPERYAYQLIVYGPDGMREQVGSWLVGSDGEVRIEGGTRLAGPDLLRLELTRTDGTPVLRYDVP